MIRFIGVNLLRFTVLLTISLFICSGSLNARAESGGDGKSGGGEPALSSLDVEYHDVNAVYLAVSNQGVIGNEIVTGNGAGHFPRGTSNNYIFGTGFWLGARYDADDDGDLDKVFTQGYNPLAGDSEFREGTNEQDIDDPPTGSEIIGITLVIPLF
jgi:hypothetical protein